MTYNSDSRSVHGSLPLRLRSILSALCLAGGLLAGGLSAAFLPWVYREPAALWLTAPDLAEFVKFLPEVRAGSISIQRLAFLAPLFGFALGFCLLLPNHRLHLPRWSRYGAIPFIIIFALMLLSPVWSPSVLLSSEFRLQTAAAILLFFLLILQPLFRRCPFRLLWAAVSLFLIAGHVFAFRQFEVARAGISAAYADPVSLDFGAWFSIAGAVVFILGGLLMPPAHPQE
jgi:hypothetical protein